MPKQPSAAKEAVYLQRPPPYSRSSGSSSDPLSPPSSSSPRSPTFPPSSPFPIGAAPPQPTSPARRRTLSGGTFTQPVALGAVMAGVQQQQEEEGPMAPPPLPSSWSSPPSGRREGFSSGSRRGSTSSLGSRGGSVQQASSPFAPVAGPSGQGFPRAVGGASFADAGTFVDPQTGVVIRRRSLDTLMPSRPTTASQPPADSPPQGIVVATGDLATVPFAWVSHNDAAKNGGVEAAIEIVRNMEYRRRTDLATSRTPINVRLADQSISQADFMVVVETLVLPLAYDPEWSELRDSALKRGRFANRPPPPSTLFNPKDLAARDEPWAFPYAGGSRQAVQPSSSRPSTAASTSRLPPPGLDGDPPSPRPSVDDLQRPATRRGSLDSLTSGASAPPQPFGTQAPPVQASTVPLPASSPAAPEENPFAFQAPIPPGIEESLAQFDMAGGGASSALNALDPPVPVDAALTVDPALTFDPALTVQPQGAANPAPNPSPSGPQPFRTYQSSPFCRADAPPLFVPSLQQTHPALSYFQAAAAAATAAQAQAQAQARPSTSRQQQQQQVQQSSPPRAGSSAQAVQGLAYTPLQDIVVSVSHQQQHHPQATAPVPAASSRPEPVSLAIELYHQSTGYVHDPRRQQQQVSPPSIPPHDLQTQGRRSSLDQEAQAARGEQHWSYALAGRPSQPAETVMSSTEAFQQQLRQQQHQSAMQHQAHGVAHGAGGAVPPSDDLTLPTPQPLTHAASGPIHAPTSPTYDPRPPLLTGSPESPSRWLDPTMMASLRQPAVPTPHQQWPSQQQQPPLAHDATMYGGAQTYDPTAAFPTPLSTLPHNAELFPSPPLVASSSSQFGYPAPQQQQGGASDDGVQPNSLHMSWNQGA
ncbi:hypothetical protein JCM6882_009595 [Rhodosporidiobolus microsporus]